MGLTGLAGFITAMWLLVLGLAALLVTIVSPLDVALIHANFTRFTISIIEAIVAIIAVLAVIVGLSRMKRLYLRLKLRN